MSGTHEGGKKSAQVIAERYGEETRRQWGAQGNAARKNPVTPFRDNPELASVAGKKGGGLGHRCRTITPNDKLRNDEWALLLKFINRAAGTIRLEDGSIDAMEQHHIYHLVFEYWEKEDWVSAITKVSDHPNFCQTLYKVISDEFVEYTERVQGQPRRSPDREHLRVVRNIKAAYEGLGVK